MIQKFVFGVIVLYLSVGSLFAQTSNHTLKIRDKGVPLMKNYLLEDYPELFHNWQILQGSKGLLYIANDNGIVEFDGVDQRLISLNEQAPVKALAQEPQGKIYVAGNGHLGFLQANAVGKLKYHSFYKQTLKFKVPLPTFTKIIITPHHILFFSPVALYAYHPITREFVRIPAKTRFHSIFKVNKNIYIQDIGTGLWQLNGSQLSLLAKSEVFINKKVNTMLPFDDDKILIGTFRQGFYVYDTHTFTPWSPANDQLTKPTQLYTGLQLSTNYFAFGTLNTGVLVFNKQGQLVKKIDKAKGLNSNAVFSLCIDQQKRLWLGLERGIAHIDIFSPFAVLNEKIGLEGVVYTALRHQQKLYFGTSQGVFYQDLQGTPANNYFKKVDKATGQNWFLTQLPNQQLAGGHALGILGLDQNQKASFVPHKSHVFSMLPLIQQPNLLLACAQDGLYRWEINNKEQTLQKLKGFQGTFQETSLILETKKGNIWTANANGILKLQLNPNKDSVTNHVYYGKKQGLPSHTGNRIFLINHKLFATTQQGIYEYNPTQDKFQYHSLSDIIGKGKPVMWLHQDSQGRIWVLTKDQTSIIEKNLDGKSYKKTEIKYDMFKVRQSPFIYFIDKKNVVLSISQGVVWYNLNHPPSKDTSFKALIRRVDWERGEGADSLLFAGHYIAQAPSHTFNAAINDFRFTVASNHFSLHKSSRFQYWLEGYDQNWSSWTSSRKKEYTNLSPGKYTFRVRTKDSQGNISKVAQYSFTITIPWYKSTWVYLLAALCTLGLALVLFWWNSRRLTRKTAHLEALVAERTEELTQQRDKLRKNFSQLEEQKGDLIYKNVKLERQQEEIMAQSESLQDALDELQIEKKQKEEALRLVEARNHYYTSGIRYAQTIQQAILPDETAMRQVFDDHFVFYSPKDIVSGDFYWFSHISENIYEQITGEKNKSITLVAVIDCTGHGVPGAFMSMIGNTLLNEIVNQRHFFSPVRILEMLNTKIRLSLRQEEKYNADGMDVCFCLLEPMPGNEETLVSFTGARRPLYYKINQETALKELKGDRKIIGGWHRKKRAFTNQSLLLPKGAAIYLTTDGLVGLASPDGTKFSSLRIKDFFDKHAHLPMLEQKKLLEKTISEHQQGIEQRDDMTIMGIRL
jgi:serine phosphatase RsbU (regulator of sigma subunit)